MSVVKVKPDIFKAYFEEHIKDEVETLLGQIVKDIAKARKFSEIHKPSEDLEKEAA